MRSVTAELPRLSKLFVGLREAAGKINGAAFEIATRRERSDSWVQRVIQRELESRGQSRGPAYWDEVFPSLSLEARANARIERMLTRATLAGVVAAAGATSAELLPLITENLASPIAVPLGLLSVGAEMLYTTALQIDLGFDLASIYGVPLAADDVGAISTLLAAALGVDLVDEPTRHDKPAAPGETKTWRVLRQMRRGDFARRLGNTLLEQALARNVVPVLSVLVSAAWNQIMLRRFARLAHTAARRRLAIVNACRDLRVADRAAARFILDGGFLIATADGDINHQEALALATLIDSFGLPDRMSVREASFTDDEEEWFTRLPLLERGVHPILIHVLVLVAGASGSLEMPERRFLCRLARALPCVLDFDAIERLLAQVREGEPLQHHALYLGETSA